jgi:hypothetical protein
MREFLPGLEVFQEIDISNIEMSSFNSRTTHINPNLPEREVIMYYTGLFKNGEKIKDTNGWLGCSTGLSRNKLIDKYDFVILFYAEKITKERTKTILKELRSTTHNTLE